MEIDRGIFPVNYNSIKQISPKPGQAYTLAFRASLYSCYVLLCLSTTPAADTSDTQCPDAGYICLLSDCRTAVVPHLAAQHLGKMYATNPPPSFLPPRIFPRSSFPIGILDYIFLMMCATRRRLCSTKRLRADRSPWAHCSKHSRSSCRDRGRGKEPGLPDKCRVKNRLLDSSSNAADNIGHPSFTAILCPEGMVLCNKRDRQKQR